jgi:hypothetical protein
MAMHAKPHLAGANLDDINAYNDIERECPEAVIRDNPYLHRLLPFFEMLYKKGAGDLWYYDDAGNFVLGARNK